ncbi:flagellar hook-length control protein FliK [Rheinheimera maricola]|uniref:Flagellar hook-length control protein FliK n=1 Tax=Rheinheimera maricola TaxID=2793282 RepID=A0ABS7X6B2_9GAMM|nr:flagellar hook-length control protein FliK [Rheinheimera maricola]MBZ9610258.1 flagellar hook-length control protein FliK [Rheinheimera maricola]
MNPINLDKLLQLSPAQKADTAQLKLIVAQVYQAQVQQLSSGSFSLKLPTAGGALSIALPASLPADMRGAVQVQLQPANNGQLHLTLQGVTQSLKLPLTPAQTSQLLTTVLTSDVFVDPQEITISRLATANANLLQIPVSLLRQPQGITMRLPDGSLQPLSAATQLAITQQLAQSEQAMPATGLRAMLQLQSTMSPLSIQLTLLRPVLSEGSQSLLRTQPTEPVLFNRPSQPGQPAQADTTQATAAKAGTAQIGTVQTNKAQTGIAQQAPQAGKLAEPGNIIRPQTINTPAQPGATANRLQTTTPLAEAGTVPRQQPLPKSVAVKAITLPKAEQSQLLQKLVQLFNQQAQNTTQAAASKALTDPQQVTIRQILSNIMPAAQLPSGTHQLQLQSHAQQWQLLLTTIPRQINMTVSPAAFNKPLQLMPTTTTVSLSTSVQSQSPSILPQTAGAIDARQTPETLQVTLQGPLQAPQRTSANSTPHQPLPVLQQAWRNLLPLLPQQADPLASLPQLPEPVQRILQLIRHSQPSVNKGLSPQQLTSQLNSLLQFQPLQPAATIQTSGGALAVAIQLLLGHLLQKPQAASAAPANKPLAQLVSQLEPAQASSLLRQLAGHSSKLQHSQLATLDSPQQQQLLLQLPLQQGEHSVFSQIMLEQREADGKTDNEKQTLWQLTLKFDLRRLGQLMVVARLQHQQLQLQFYTEQQHTQQLAQRFLPLLKDRCRVQGLEVTQAECTLGKIPDSILPRANSLLALKV